MTQNDQLPRILAAGSVTLDLIVRNLVSRDCWDAAGGTLGNVAIFMVALNAKVTLLSQVGTDRRGQRLLGHLTTAGVDTTTVERKASLHTPAIVELVRYRRSGEHRFTWRCPLCHSALRRSAVATLGQAKALAHRLAEFDVYFFDRASVATVYLAKAAQKAGALVVFEPLRRPHTERDYEAAAYSNVVKFAGSHRQEGVPWYPPAGATTQLVVESLGPRGVRWLHRNNDEWRVHHEGPVTTAAQIRDPAGAGDWLTTGILSSLLPLPYKPGEKDFREAIERGQHFSALSLAFDGPQGALQVLGSRLLQRMIQEEDPSNWVLPPGPLPAVTSLEVGSESHCALCLTDTKEFF